MECVETIEMERGWAFFGVRYSLYMSAIWPFSGDPEKKFASPSKAGLGLVLVFG